MGGVICANGQHLDGRLLSGEIRELAKLMFSRRSLCGETQVSVVV